MRLTKCGGIYKAVKIKSEITIEQRSGCGGAGGGVEEMDVYLWVHANKVLFECTVW